MAITARRKILNTGTNKYQSAVRQMQRAIYSDNVYVSLNGNTITTDVRNDLENLNSFWMTSCFMQRVVRDNYRLCFRRRNWQKTNIYDRYDSQQEPQEQNCFAFDTTIGNGVLFLCVGNNEYNRSDIRTGSVYKPSTGYTNVNDLPSKVIELDDGYSWIALGQSDTRFTDSNWISLEIRDGISFFGNDQGTYVNDGVSLADFKTAICSPFNAGESGAAGFYPALNAYDQTSASEVASGDILYSIGNIERYDVFTMQQALKISGVNSQIRFVTGSTTGATASLPSSTTITSLYEQIANSPFTTSSPVGWYNEHVNGWGKKEGSVEMIYLDMTDITADDLVVVSSSKPLISVKGNGTSPSAEFILSKLKEGIWEIRGVKISSNLATGEREVGSGNTHVEFVVTNTDNNSLFEDALRALITPYGGLLKEENLYGPIIPINAFMISVTINESDIVNVLASDAANLPAPSTFDSYALIVDAKNESNSRELGLDLPPNKIEFIDQMFAAELTPVSGGVDFSTGAKIYEALPSTDTKIPRGELIGIVQTVENPTPISGAAYVSWSTALPNKFGDTATFYIGSGSTFKLWTQTTTTKSLDAEPLSGTLIHIGESNFDINRSFTTDTGSEKRISIKYITRV